MSSEVSKKRERIEYLDVLKGFSILWVVIYHLNDHMPDWICVPYRMPLFFFISGFFFKTDKFRVILHKRINGLLIPFLFFWFLSFLIVFVKYDLIGSFVAKTDFVGYGTFSEYSTSLFKLFRLSNEDTNDPVILNRPLWFLIVLFNVQIIYWFINNYIRLYSMLVVFACYVLGHILLTHQINGLFYLGVSLTYLIYYASGNVFGLKIDKYLDNKKFFYTVISLGLLMFFMPIDFQHSIPLVNHLFLNIRILVFVCFILAVFKKYASSKLFVFFKYCGKNSLGILAIHTLAISLCSTIINKILGLFLDIHIDQDSVLYLSLLFIFVVLISLGSYHFLKSYFPKYCGLKK